MAKNDTIHIRVNEEVKSNAEQTLSMLGLTISEAVNILLCQINLIGGLPFQVTLPAPEHLIVHSREEAAKKLNEAEEDIANGYVSSADEVFDRLRKKYDF